MTTLRRGLRALFLVALTLLLALLPSRQLSTTSTSVPASTIRALAAFGVAENVTSLYEHTNAETMDTAILLTHEDITPFIDTEQFQKAAAVYRRIAESPIPYTVSARVGGEDTVLSVIAAPRPQRIHIFVLLPENSHDTAAIDKDVMGGDSYAATYIHINRMTPVVSTLEQLPRGYRVNGVEENYNALAIELCQSYLAVEGAHRQLDSQEARLAQEIVCNSLGRAVASSLNGTGFTRYQEGIAAIGVLRPQPGTAFSLLSLNNDEYDQIQLIARR